MCFNENPRTRVTDAPPYIRNSTLYKKKKKVTGTARPRCSEFRNRLQNHTNPRVQNPPSVRPRPWKSRQKAHESMAPGPYKRRNYRINNP